MQLPICRIHLLGLVPYEQAWKLQDSLAAQIATGEQPPTLLLLEHPHVFTFGRRGQPENLLWDEAELARRRVTVHWVDRGGDVTYHGPGQLVGYPLLPLDALQSPAEPASSATPLPQPDYIAYLRQLEEVLIRALASFGVNAGCIEGLTGVWVNTAKIAAIGVKVDARHVTRHGFALNVNPDMTYWQGIIGCGLQGYPVTSLAEILPSPPPMPQVIQAVITAFGDVFGFQMLRSRSSHF
jgi:lipoyl(octanoyl) transferase